MTERIVYYAFGVALCGALTVGVGKTLVEDHGRRIIPLLALAAVVLGLLLGWAINGFVDYVRLTETSRFS